MVQPSASDHGPGEQPGHGPGTPGGTPSAHRPDRGQRVLQLTDFVAGGVGDSCPPDPDLVAALAVLSGAGWRCAGASDEELFGLLGRWAAVEAWASAGKLGVLREVLRRRAGRGEGPGGPGGLPRCWHEGTGHEVAAALAVSVPGADKLVELAWELGARLPGVAARLADGTINAVKGESEFCAAIHITWLGPEPRRSVWVYARRRPRPRSNRSGSSRSATGPLA